MLGVGRGRRNAVELEGREERSETVQALYG